MKNKCLLPNTEKERDIIDPSLSLKIYPVCNNRQFEGSSKTEFIKFMNLDKHGRQLKVKPGQKMKVSYMAEAVKNNLPYPDDSYWHSMFLGQCGIKLDYLSRHSGDFYGETSNPDNKEFIEAIQDAILNWRNGNN